MDGEVSVVRAKSVVPPEISECEFAAQRLIHFSPCPCLTMANLLQFAGKCTKNSLVPFIVSRQISCLTRLSGLTLICDLEVTADDLFNLNKIDLDQGQPQREQ